MKFQILIPTYNRCKDIQENLVQLRNQLLKYNLTKDFGIAVSDNASTDDTWSVLQGLKEEWKDEIRLDILRNETNVGLEQNTVNLLLFATAEYIIWLGDDDFLDEGYLQFIVTSLKEEQIGWLIPGITGVFKNNMLVSGRDSDFEEKKYSAGYNTIWELSHYGHQLSGLVLKREGLAETYLSKPQWRNLYLFIFFLAYNQMRYPGIFAPRYKTLVNNYNQKDWDYNSIGLLDHVFKSYNYFIETYGVKKVVKLLTRFVVIHSYRVNFSRGLYSLIKQWTMIHKSYQFGKSLKWSLLKILTKEYMKQKIFS